MPRKAAKLLRWETIAGNCLEVLKKLPDNFFDSLVSDPPYGLSFMSANWDHEVPGPEYWAEILRVMKPGAFGVAFGGTRSHHRLMCALEDGGWQLRDCFTWLYGSGFPKNHSVSMGIDKHLGAMGHRGKAFCVAGDQIQDMKGNKPGEFGQHVPITSEAKQWDGFGSALKPCWEPIIVVRKPFKTSMARNILDHGVGGLNVDLCRLKGTGAEYVINRWKDGAKPFGGGAGHEYTTTLQTDERWPPNAIIDDEVAAMLGEERSRYFYTAKASRAEKEGGLEHLPSKTTSDGRKKAANNAYQRGKTERKNNHATVKPISLMEWLCKLMSPPKGRILDPFMGSGTTGCAAVKNGFKFYGIDLDPDNEVIAKGRILQALEDSGQATVADLERVEGRKNIQLGLLAI
jgi:site-specific DNA-methyltransferase (adenine-specific)